MLHEASVSVSDFGLAALSAVLAGKLLLRDTEKLSIRKWFGVEIGAVALAALLGGIAHGFFPDTDASWGALIWRTTLICVGLTGLAALMIASFLLFRPSTIERVRIVGLLVFAIYCGIVLFEWQRFAVALAFYVPPTLLLFVAFLVRWRKEPNSFASDGLVAMALTFVAAGIQHFGVELDPVYLNHNVIYHIVQAAAVVFLYRAGRRWLTESAQFRARAI